MKKFLLFILFLVAFFMTTNVRADISAISGPTSDSVAIYPIPNNGTFNVLVSSVVEKNFSIVIYNLIGKEVYKCNNLNTNQIVNFETFIDKGSYFYTITCNKSIYRGKMIIT
jgi:hypothetical protein